MTTQPKIASMRMKGKQKRSYFQEVKQEIKKVSWTQKKDLILNAKIVVGATFFLGLGIYFADLIIRTVLSSIESIGRLITG